MSLTKFLALTDDSLKARYEAKEIDPATIRKPFLKALETAREQFLTGRTKAPNRMWTAKGDIVKFTPKLRGAPLAIEGKTEFLIPSERFSDSITALLASVNAGELDAVLQGSEGTASKPSAGAKSGGGRSEEANARAALSRYLGPLKMKLADAAKAMKDKGKFSDDLIDRIVAERK